MMQLRAELRGADHLIRELEFLNRRVSGPLLQIIGATGVSYLVEEIEKRVPVLTGLLDTSMGAQVDASRDGSFQFWVGPRAGYNRPGYGDPEEYGEVIEEKGSPAGRGKAFMKQSAKAAAPRIREAAIAILRAGISGSGF